MGKKRDRDRQLARRTPYRDPKPVILIVTEGEVTEPKYLEGFVSATRNPRVRIETVGGAGVPKTIVESAKELKNEAGERAQSEKDENLSYNEVWCVFDRDEHPKFSDAKQMARDNGIELAVSNPCFELWLLLHFAEQPGMKHRDKLKSMMKKHIPNYDKHVDYSDYSAGYEEAVRRARRLDDIAEKGINPTTGVWRLTESIRSDP